MDGNPLENLNLVADPAENIVVIMKDGKIHKNDQMKTEDSNTRKKPISLNRLLMLQMAYAFAGIMYNVGSLLALRNGQPAWAPADPVVGE